MIRTATAVFLLCLFGCTASVHVVRSGEGAEQVEAAIAAAWRAHIVAAQRKDLGGVCELYADDVHYVVAGQPEARGRIAIEAMERTGMQTTEVFAAMHSSLALRADGAVAHELGTVQGDVASDGRAAKHVVFHYVAAWRRGVDGVWRIAHLVGHVEGTVGREP